MSPAPETYFWNRFDLRSKLLFDAVQGEAVLVRYQVDRDPEVTESSRATDTMKVRLRHLGKVEVDHNIHCLDIYSPRKQI